MAGCAWTALELQSDKQLIILLLIMIHIMIVIFIVVLSIILIILLVHGYYKRRHSGCKRTRHDAIEEANGVIVTVVVYMSSLSIELT